MEIFKQPRLTLADPGRALPVGKKQVLQDQQQSASTRGVEQLTRYLDLLNRDPLLAPVQGIFAAQEIKPQARVLAEDRGIRCVTLDYESMRGTDDGALRLF